MSRQVSQAYSGLPSKHAPVIAFKVHNFDFDEVIAWINNLPDSIAQASQACAPESSQNGPSGSPPARELRIDLICAYTGQAIVDPMSRSLDQWCECFTASRTAASSRTISLNIRYTVALYDGRMMWLLRQYRHFLCAGFLDARSREEVGKISELVERVHKVELRKEAAKKADRERVNSVFLRLCSRHVAWPDLWMPIDREVGKTQKRTRSE